MKNLDGLRRFMLVLGGVAAIVAASGCSSLGIESQTAVQPPALNPLTKTEKQKLKDVLLGETQTVYESDTGLARVYGQVANLGTTSYREVEFDLVANVKRETSSADTTFRKVIGRVRVEYLKPKEVRPFDVQSTAQTGSIKEVKVVLRAARK